MKLEDLRKALRDLKPPKPKAQPKTARVPRCDYRACRAIASYSYADGKNRCDEHRKCAICDKIEGQGHARFADHSFAPRKNRT